MTFTAPLGLLALLAIPAIVVIHLFRRRFPPRHVAGLFLWKVVQQTPQGGGRVSKLPVTASLILECLAKVPSRRPASADVLWERLDRVRLTAEWNQRRARTWWEMHEPELVGHQ